MGFITHHEVKQRSVGDRMRTVIVGKFSMGDVISPRSRIVPTEDPEVHMFQLLGLLVQFLCLIEDSRQWRGRGRTSRVF